MTNFAENVVKFNAEVLGIELGSKTLMSKDEMMQTLSCLSEEVREFLDAHESGNYVETVDALIDLMYFAIGGLHKLGLTPDEMAKCGEAIHMCNMEKKKGIVARRSDGKVPDAVKPPSWVGPEQHLASILGKL